MMLIGYTRYEMISEGAMYQHNSRKILSRLTITWIINISLYVPPLFVDLWTGVKLSGNGTCRTEFFQLLDLWSFYMMLNTVVPPAAVFLIYIAVYLALKSRSKTGPVVAAIEQNGRHQATNKRQGQALNAQTGALFLLVVTLLLTSFPTGIIDLVYSSNTAEAYSFCLFFLYSNSLLNTIVYTSKVPTAKNSLLRMLGMRRTETIAYSPARVRIYQPDSPVYQEVINILLWAQTNAYVHIYIPPTYPSLDRHRSSFLNS